MPVSSPRPRAPIWGESWTVGHDVPNDWTVITFYDAVPFPRLDIRLTPPQVSQLIHDLDGSELCQIDGGDSRSIYGEDQVIDGGHSNG